MPVTAVSSTLIECDPSIKAIIVKINKELGNTIVVEDLDENTLIIKTSELANLKQLLEEELAETQQPPDDSGSE